MTDVTIEKIVYKLESVVDEAIRGFDRVEKSIQGVDKKMETTSKSMEKAATVVSKAWKMVALAVTAAGGMIGRATILSSVQLEEYMVTLENLYGDLETAGDKMAWLMDFAKETPFELPGLVDALRKLKAYGIEGDAVMRSIGDASAALGKTLDMGVEALADAQTGEFERLKEFGIKAVEITKNNYESLGATQADVGLTALTYVDSQMQQGIKVIDRNNRAAITAAITGIWDENYFGGMEDLAQTAKGTWSNIWDALYRGETAFMGFDAATKTFREGSLFDRMKTSLVGVRSAIEGFDFASFGQGIERFLDMVGQAKTYIAPFVDAISRIGVAVWELLEDVGEAVGVQLYDDLSGLWQLVEDVGGLILFNLNAVATGLEMVAQSDAFKVIGLAIREIAESVSILYTWFREKLVTAIDFFIEKYNAIVPILQKAGMDVETISMDMFNPMKDSAKSAHDEVTSEVDQMVSEYSTALDVMSGKSKNADIIPGKRASYAQILGVDAVRDIKAQATANGQDLSFLGAAYDPTMAAMYGYGNASIPPAQIPQTPTIPAADTNVPTAGSQGSGPTQEQMETLTQKVSALNTDITKALKEEPRKIDAKVQMNFTIKTDMDVRKLERTIIKATTDGIYGKGQVT